jgi:hypothetical protein
MNLRWDEKETNNQTPSTKHQIITKFSMTKLSNMKQIGLGDLNIGYWKLFGAWSLGIGI